MMLIMGIRIMKSRNRVGLVDWVKVRKNGNWLCWVIWLHVWSNRLKFSCVTTRIDDLCY